MEKTATKEMIKHILSGAFEVEFTIRNYNLFRSNSSVLANLDVETDFSVFEFGVDKASHLDRCCRYFGPFTTIITGIDVDRIERFGTFENYRKEKAKILNGAGDHQSAILNADCYNTLKISELYPNINKIWFGLGENADVRAQNINYTENRMDFTLICNQNSYAVQVPCFGLHNVYNALAAISAVCSNGVDLQWAIQRLVTNINKGGSSLSFDTVLKSHPYLSYTKSYEAISHLSIKMEKHLEKYTEHIADLAFDMALNKDVHLYLIESNFRGQYGNVRYKGKRYQEWKAKHFNPIGYGRFLIDRIQ